LAGAGLILGAIVPVQGELKITEGLKPTKVGLTVTDKLAAKEKELVVETDEWKVVFSLLYNGGIFDYNVYLLGDQEFTTTTGRNNEPGLASLEIIENTPVRLRVRQKCQPRLNNGDGPANDKYVELDMVETTTEWTFYPTGRVNIKFDAVVAKDWDGICSRGPGGSGKGIIADGDTITAANGTDFTIPWVTHGDTIESTAGGWGPVQIVKRIGKDTLRLATAVKPGKNMDFIIRRPNILDETISIHADGDSGMAPRKSFWQGGSDGDTLFENKRSNGGFFRDGMLPVEKKKLDRFYECLRTPIAPDEPESRPFTLPDGVEPAPRRLWFKHPDFEIPKPSFVGIVGFIAGWAAVAMLIASFFWIIKQ